MSTLLSGAVPVVVPEVETDVVPVRSAVRSATVPSEVREVREVRAVRVTPEVRARLREEARAVRVEPVPTVERLGKFSRSFRCT